jgi:hypothetical protein
LIQQEELPLPIVQSFHSNFSHPLSVESWQAGCKPPKWSRAFIDEYLFVVTPVVLGAGKPLFQDVKQFPLELLEARDFHSGNVLLHYSIDKKSND